MRNILVPAAAAAALIPAPANAQQVFRCDEGGNAHYYRVGPGEFRNWVGAGNGYAARWLDNECTSLDSCNWNAGVLTLDGFDWRREFNTNTGLYRWGPPDEPPTEQQCYRDSDPPPG